MEKEIDLEDPVFSAALQLLLDKANTPPLKNWTEEEVKELYIHAYYFFKNGKYQEAVDTFRLLTHIDASDVGYWSGLAAALKMQNQHAEALDCYCLAILLDAEDPMLHAHAADCCFALGRIDRGLEALENAEELAAGQEKYRLMLSQLEIIKNKYIHNHEV